MSPAAELLEKAIAMLRPGDKLALCSDAQSYAGKVLLALARPDAACVIQIDAAEYSGIKVLGLAGMGDMLNAAPAAHDIEALKQERMALRLRKTKTSLIGVPA